jgi:hypothetical protein
MKHNDFSSFFSALSLLIFFAACAASACAARQEKKVIFRPDGPDNPPERSRPFDLWEITNSQNGPAGIPDWVRFYYNNEVKEIEALGRFSGKYVLIGTHGGDNFNALQHWANGFAVDQDLPRLVTLRVERRLIASASLYPDDEYGEYFEFLIREISNAQFSGAVKEQTFWLRRKVAVSGDEADDAGNIRTQERYEFLVLMSVDKETLQKQIQGIMAGIKTNVSPTRDQAAAIARIKNNFFEGF